MLTNTQYLDTLKTALLDVKVQTQTYLQTAGISAAEMDSVVLTNGIQLIFNFAAGQYSINTLMPDGNLLFSEAGEAETTQQAFRIFRRALLNAAAIESATIA